MSFQLLYNQQAVLSSTKVSLLSTTISENANSLQFELGNFLEDKAPLLQNVI